MYCRKGDGGCGLPKLSDMVRSAHLKALVTIETREDAVLVALVRGAENSRANKLARVMGLKWPTTSAAIERWKFERKTQYLSKWAAQPFQGKGVRYFKGNRVGNDWLFNPTLAAGEKIDLMQMRSNVFPVRTSIARAEKVGADDTCRRCRVKPETLLECTWRVPSR